MKGIALIPYRYRKIITPIVCVMASLMASAQVNDTTEIKPNFAVYPAIAYSPETSFQLGVMAFLVFNKNPDTTQSSRPNLITPKIIYSIRNQLTIGVYAQFYLKNNLRWLMDSEFLNFPDYFFGVGTGTSPDTKELYTRQYFNTNGSLMKSRNSIHFGGLLFDIEYDDIQDIKKNGLLATEHPIGIDGGRVMGLGLGFVMDSRNHNLYPTKGKYIRIGALWYGPMTGSQYQYSNYSFDYRQYQRLFNDNSVLAFQFLTNLNYGDVPFFKLSKLGGKRNLRGIENSNLYTDKNAIYGQIEGRQHLFWRIGGVLFAAVGQVFDSFSEFDVENMRATYGIGGRFQVMKHQPLNVRLDLGFSDNGQHAFYFAIQEAF